MQNATTSDAIVRYATKSRRALAEPQFFIERGGKLYLTVGVLVFDENDPKATDEQKSIISKLRAELLSAGVLDDAAVYVEHPQMRKLMYGPCGANTEPPCQDDFGDG